MANKVYFIRHAATAANLSGEMLKNYDSFDIEAFNSEDWWKKTGKSLSDKSAEIWVSPTVRCESTARALFGDNTFFKKEPLLKELDCSGLGTKKFWEISKDEFDTLCHPDMAAFKHQVIDLVNKLVKEDTSKNIICITHGLFIRHLYNFLTSQGDSELYDLINSKSFKFRNLDMLTCKIKNNDLIVEGVYRYD